MRPDFKNIDIKSINKEIKIAQSLFKKYNTNSNSAVDEFLESRKIDANNENRKSRQDEFARKVKFRNVPPRRSANAKRRDLS